MTSNATLETLTAKVHTLQIGHRQLTLSMAKQLDSFPINEEHITDFEALGRIRITGKKYLDPLGVPVEPRFQFIGKHHTTGELMTLICQPYELEDQLQRRFAEQWLELPLIVLGGLK